MRNSHSQVRKMYGRLPASQEAAEMDSYDLTPSLHQEMAHRSNKMKQQKFLSGWRVGVSICAMVAIIVCVVNVIVTIAVGTAGKFDEDISLLYEGSCKKVSTMSFWAHMSINIMSTLLLSGSNYTMQILSSPTREEIDREHRRFRWMDIGIPSVRNLRKVSWARIAMWWLLALSSVPLHLVYNTAVFSSIAANGYFMTAVTEPFVNGASYNLTDSRGYLGFTYDSKMDLGEVARVQELAQQNKLLNITTSECIDAYSAKFISKYSNVVLVTQSKNQSLELDPRFGSVVSLRDYDPYDREDGLPDWICHSTSCTADEAKKAANKKEWTYVVDNYYGIYCLVEETAEHCELNFSIPMMVVVIVCNAIKAVVMVTALMLLKTPTIVTVGDAIATFIENPDPTTEGMCLATKSDVTSERWRLKRPIPWVSTQHYWFRAASWTRWTVCNLLCCATIIVGGVLLQLGVRIFGSKSLDRETLQKMWDMGFGAIDLNSVVDFKFTPNITSGILIANLPQGILSILYITYNGLFSCVLSGDEWNRFGYSRKSLRVTAPRGRQRSTYFLSMPYKYGIPLMFISIGLHWLMSQSLFMIRVIFYDYKGNRTPTVTQVGYSCIAILFAIILGSLAVAAGILNGFRKYRPGIPLAAGCSAVISAACHMTEPDPFASLKALRWGAVPENDASDEGDDERVGHCTFSSAKVEMPKPGKLYAGVRKRRN